MTINKSASQYAWTFSCSVDFNRVLSLISVLKKKKFVFSFEDLGERGPLPPLQASFQMPVKIPSKASSQEPVQELRTKRDCVLF